MKDLAHEECKYRFKGNSCKECPLDCVYKDKNALYSKYKALEADCDLLWNKLKEKNKKIEELTLNLGSEFLQRNLALGSEFLQRNQLELSQYARNLEDKLAKTEQKLEKIRKVAKNCVKCKVCVSECKYYNNLCDGCFETLSMHILEERKMIKLKELINEK